jgi:hypothetical protein
MFDTAAAQLVAAVQKWDGGQGSDGSLPDGWSSIRRLCKDAMVCLESHGQHTLAARVEREYERLKETSRAIESDGANGKGRILFVDAAQELHTTLVALHRFQNHLAQNEGANGDSGASEQASSPTASKSDRREDRGVVTDQRLHELFRANYAKYKRMGQRIIAGDMVTKRQFSAEFGSTVLAHKWAAEEGRADDLDEVNRWGTAIRSSTFYKAVFRPFTGREVSVPCVWQIVMRDDNEFSDVIAEAARLSEGAS